MTRLTVLVSLAALVLAACSSDSDQVPLPEGPPTQVALVTDENIASPMDAVASHDGKTFYFTAYDTSPTANAESPAAIFSVPARGGTPRVLFEGPPLEDPSGLVLSCDGETLFVSDISAEGAVGSSEVGADESPLYRFDLGSKTLSPISTPGIAEAGSLALSSDCSTLYITGYNEAGEAALFRMPAAGGAVSVVLAGEPLLAPTGVYVDENNVAWVMDQQPHDVTGGVLFAVAEDGSVSRVMGELGTSEPAGVSLFADTGIAVIPHRDRDSGSQILTVDINSGEMTVIDTPQMVEPAGMRSARNAGVIAIVDMDGNAIYRAQ